MNDTGSEMVFSIPGLTKTRRKTGQKPLLVSFSEFTPDKDLNRLECLRVYMDRTVVLRSDTRTLLIATVKPCTVVRWLKCAMDLAGIDTNQFKGHSTRFASTSKAAHRGSSAAEIMSKANCANARTFRCHYYRDMSDEFQILMYFQYRL